MNSYICFTLLIFAACLSENSGLTEQEKREFVDAHNVRRNQVARGQVRNQPAASNMKKMAWDEELYKKASDWAKQNRKNHNPDKSVPSGRFRTGENLYWYSTTARNFKLRPEKVVESWFSEHANYTYGPIRNSDFDGSKNYQIGHYTQIVWADTTHVGCEILSTNKGRWTKFFAVCNYGPAGNYLGEVPYKKA